LPALEGGAVGRYHGVLTLTIVRPTGLPFEWSTAPMYRVPAARPANVAAIV
jgi:hypothetical protein